MAAEGNIDKEVRDIFFAHQRDGVLVEVGAARPDFLSIGQSFRELGWKVISIEPNPEFCAAHRANGHEVLQYACSDEESDNAEFFVVDSNRADYMGDNISFESFSSLGITGKFAELHETVRDSTNVKTIPVKVRKLDTILAEHHPTMSNVDIVAVDVEGWELNVMRGFSLDRYRPGIVILENLFYDKGIERYMKESGYALLNRDYHPNEVYVRRDLLRLSLLLKNHWIAVSKRMRRCLQLALRRPPVTV